MFLAGCSEPKGRGAIFGSADGLRWDLIYQEEAKEKGYTFFDFLDAGGMTVAVGGADGMSKNGPARILVSKDGKGWEGPCFKFDSSGPFLCVARGNGRIVAHGGSGYVSCFSYSSDGVAWADADKNRLPGYGGEQSMVKKLAFGNGLFVGIGAYRRLVTSSDGVTWKDNPDKDRPPFLSLAFGNGRFVAAGMHGLRMSSADGLRWGPSPRARSASTSTRSSGPARSSSRSASRSPASRPTATRGRSTRRTPGPRAPPSETGSSCCANLRGTEAYRSRDAVTWERIPPIKDHLFFGGFGHRPG